MNKAIFIDKDGTLIEDVPYNVNPDNVRFTEGAIEGLQELQAKGYLLIVISNQSGLAHGYFTERDLHFLIAKLTERLNDHGIRLDDFFFCPHHPAGKVSTYSKHCTCRKPMPGMIHRAAKRHNVDLGRSWMIGDILNDVEAGNLAGCRTILVNVGNETEWDRTDTRHPTAIVENFREATEVILHQFELA